MKVETSTNRQYLLKLCITAVVDFIEKSWENTDAAIRNILVKRLESDNDHSFFAFNVQNVKQKLTFWNKNFPRVKPFFAMKANHSDVAIQTMANLANMLISNLLRIFE